MKIYLIIKASYTPNPDDCPNIEYVLIDCVRASEDAARERLGELAREGYRNCDYIPLILR